jgi:hypothetical protein
VTSIDYNVIPTGFIGPTAAARKCADRETYVLLFQALEAVTTIAILVAVKSAIAAFFKAL